jgi:hypothetical protein
MRDHEYFKHLEPSAVPGELAHYGVSAAALASCIAPCGCCVGARQWNEIGDPAVWFEVWWLWFANREVIKELVAQEA